MTIRFAAYSEEEIGARFAEIRPPLSNHAALAEAQRCLYCFDAPCSNACPTHIDVPRFIKKIANGNLRGSALAILDANILGLSCSRVCPVDVLCEGSCVMHGRGERPIEIGRLQRHAMEHFYTSGGKLSTTNTPGPPVRAVCIGAGPASLACAAELRRHGATVTVFERRSFPGGLNTYGVAEYKLRPKVSLQEVELVRSLGVVLETGKTVGEDVSLQDLERDFDAIFIGVGLGPGRTLEGAADAVDFIADYKMGRKAKVGRRVLVVGSGNTAMDAAVAAKLLGAEEVTIIYRRGEADMSAFPFESEHAKQVGVTFEWQVAPLETGDGVLRCIREGREVEFGCDQVIRAIGQTSLVESIAAGRGIGLVHGRVQVNRVTGRTSNPKYYAGGDCVNGGREVVDAVADGKRAALGILEALHG